MRKPATYRHFAFLPISAVLIFLLFSCKKYVQTDATFFVKASHVVVDTQALQGTASHKITDFWLYVNGNFQGAYPVGNLMPVVTKNQKIKIEIFAGIKNNGISGTRIPWNFYQKLTFDTLVENGANIERPFTFIYNPTTTFAWLENFDSGSGISMVRSAISDTGFVIASPENSFEGKSLELGLNASGLVGQIESTKSFTLPQGNGNVYMELNYKSNTVFEVGLVGSNTVLKGAVDLNPQENWNKIYIQMAGVVNSEPVSSSYKVYFKILNQDGNTVKLFLDNIKLIYL